MKLDDAQIQEDILQIENFKSLGQIRHKAHKINSFHDLAKIPPIKAPAARKRRSGKNPLEKCMVTAPID